MKDWGRKKEPGLGTRILLQVIRFALVALFFYIAYLGIIWQITPAPSRPPAQKKVQPAAPAAKPASPAQAVSPSAPSPPPAPKEPAAPSEPPAGKAQ